MNKFYNTLKTLKVGDRVVVPKSGVELIQHHTIFLGYQNRQFLFIENKEGLGVRVTDSETLFRDVTYITRVIRFKPTWGYSRADLFNYALSKKGRSYHLFNYNCEHFANEVQHKARTSKQTENFIAIVFFSLLLFIIGAFASSGLKNQ